MERQLTGISVILFGILLCCAEREWNNIVFTSFDMPMSVIGVIIGIVGLIIVFTKGNGK